MGNIKLVTARIRNPKSPRKLCRLWDSLAKKSNKKDTAPLPFDTLEEEKKKNKKVDTALLPLSTHYWRCEGGGGDHFSHEPTC